ncbi:acetylcholine receptor subunit alpha-like 2 [Pseudomyrmex gracilis]|uniref:acetylcholine receptor subunit alpha-like 2 n=1 Tax=Pseudomyrmex gracilis TaxID=219809 RepID=UPI000994F28C|nr:acetylcholine receptor subunit alpha-like 2 [Pseudomyrmex gracilis]XP_020288861.1 acetylcholine receptor subunit alpha-like 2 [Pseudomyrmex gracilis]XP_020288862.1 acetylcholine receptor subunit alpha-like 2 [Pseudomyrmex gracilis]
MLPALIILILSVQISYSNPDAKRLYDDLLSNYNRLIRPVFNNTDTVVVKLGLRLSQLIDLNLKDQILTTNVWLEHEWQDHKFQWDPTEYGGVTELYVPSEHIWLPDIVLYNNADGEYGVTTMTKAVLHYTGRVVWTPPAIFKSSCEIDVRYFPFDQQICFMKFGSWTYDGFQIDLKHINQNVSDKVDVGIDLREYYLSVEWDIMDVPAERHRKYYPCCLEPYPDIFFNITLRRKTLFYTVNLIVPCVSISYLSVLAFYLPADSGEKIALCINILLSQTMFFLLISEIIPSTSLALPLLGKYLLFTMVLVGLSVVATIAILNLHYRKPSTHKMSPWLRKFFIRRLPKLLLMRVPEDLLIDLAAHKISTRKSQKKSKFDAAIAAASSSILSSPDSARHQQIDGCNGLYRTTAQNRFLSRLVYNGLPTVMSDLDESLSDVTPKKKYPFELEKAIHNIMFIKHHIQRQDEYNAEDQDWAFVAMVLDRLFLWIFSIASIAGTFMILCEAPALYDDTKPIDVVYSKVAQQQFRLHGFGPDIPENNTTDL